MVLQWSCNGPERYPLYRSGSLAVDNRCPRMKIAHVVRSYGSLTEPFVAQRVSQVGADVQLWYERLAGPAPGVPSRRMPWLPLRARPFDGLLYRTPGIAIRIGAPAYQWIERLEQPDVIHAHYLTTGCLVGHRTVSPLVVSCYGFDVLRIPTNPSWRRSIGELIPRASMFLVEGPHMAAALSGIGIPDSKIALVPIGASLQEIEFADYTARRACALLITGRFVAKKGISVAIRALAALGTRSSPPTLDIVVDGPLRETLVRMVSDLGLNSRVTFHGYVSRMQYLALVASAELVLAPSVTAPDGDTEGGAPTTILDAQATGTIVIGSRHADIPFLVQDDTTGYLAAEGDAHDLALTIERAFATRSEWARIALAARHQVEARHSDAAVWAALGRVHTRALSAKIE